jgi:hypothetical protein
MPLQALNAIAELIDPDDEQYEVQKELASSGVIPLLVELLTDSATTVSASAIETVATLVKHSESALDRCASDATEYDVHAHLILCAHTNDHTIYQVACLFGLVWDIRRAHRLPGRLLPFTLGHSAHVLGLRLDIGESFVMGVTEKLSFNPVQTDLDAQGIIRCAGPRSQPFRCTSNVWIGVS